MANLTQKCVPCEGDATFLLSKKEIAKNLTEVRDWETDSESAPKSLHKLFSFKDFAQAMKFVNNVAAIAEQEGHHPDIEISYNKVTLTLSTHAISGLSLNDFILADKINEIR